MARRSALRADFVVASAVDAGPGYLLGVLALVESLGRFGACGADAFVLLHVGLPPRALGLVEDGCRRHGLAFEALECQAAGATPVVIETRLGVSAMLRIGLPEVLPGVHRALYLDADTLVVQPITELGRLDLHGRTAAAVVDRAVPVIPDSVARLAGEPRPEGQPYFNSGVLLLDLDLCRQRQLTRRCAAAVDELSTGLQMLDQDVLNAMLLDDWLPLDPCFNVVPVPQVWRSLQAAAGSRLQSGAALIQEMCDLEQSARILHFLGARKPWQASPRQGPALDLFRATCRDLDRAEVDQVLAELGGDQALGPAFIEWSQGDSIP